jgi:hypothetical protein
LRWRIARLEEEDAALRDARQRLEATSSTSTVALVVIAVLVRPWIAGKAG